MEDCDVVAEEPEDGAYRGELEGERNIVTYVFVLDDPQRRRTKDGAERSVATGGCRGPVGRVTVLLCNAKIDAYSSVTQRPALKFYLRCQSSAEIIRVNTQLILLINLSNPSSQSHLVFRCRVLSETSHRDVQLSWGGLGLVT